MTVVFLDRILLYINVASPCVAHAHWLPAK